MANATTGQSGSMSATASAHDGDRLKGLLEDARDTTREQLIAAWQIESERISEQIASSWRNHLERVFEERFEELSARLEEQLRSSIDSTAAAAKLKARQEISTHLNQAVRRLTVFDSESDWGRAVVDGSEGFCERAALFSISGPSLRLEVVRELPRDARIDNTPLQSAPAFAGAIESRDPVAALRTRGELSDPVAELVGEAPDKKFYLFPIRARERVAAILYADSENGAALDVSALELLTTVAGFTLEGLVTETPARTELVSIATAAGAAPSVSSWFSLTKKDQELHLRAQRFARVQAAEMRLYKSQQVKEGRLQRNIYGALREEIDSTRNAFRRDFLSASPTMVDYIHVELLRTLANDDAELLGPDYPGPMA